MDPEKTILSSTKMLSTGGNFGNFTSISHYHQCETPVNRYLHWCLLENRSLNLVTLVVVIEQLQQRHPNEVPTFDLGVAP
jgi:hypothetical protein